MRDFGAETETILELNCRDSEQESERFWSGEILDLNLDLRDSRPEFGFEGWPFCGN